MILRLAAAHGMTACEFLACHTSREIAELEAMETTDPVTNFGVVMQLASLCAMFFNVHRGDSSPKSSVDMLVFNPKPEKTRQQKAEEINAALAAMFGG